MVSSSREQSMKISSRLWASFAAFTAIQLLIIVVIGHNTRAGEQEADAAFAELGQKNEIAGQWLAVAPAVAARSDSLARAGSALGDPIKAALASDIAVADKAIAKMQAVRLDAPEQKWFEQAKTAHQHLKAGIANGGSVEQIKAWSESAATYAAAVTGLVQEFQAGYARQQSKAVVVREGAVAVGVMGASTLLISMFVGILLLVRSIRAPVAEAVGLADRIAVGDLGGEASTARNDELGEVLRALVAMRGSLAKLVTEVRARSTTISQASDAIAEENNNLSARTELSASNLQQTAASMEQMMASVKTSADSAAKADNLATTAAEVAARGGRRWRKSSNAWTPSTPIPRESPRSSR